MAEELEKTNTELDDKVKDLLDFAAGLGIHAVVITASPTDAEDGSMMFNVSSKTEWRGASELLVEAVQRFTA